MSKIYGPLGYLRELFLRFSADQCPAWAASLSFFAVLSIAPILLCGLAVLGFILRDAHSAALQFQHVIARIVPDPASARSIMEQLNIEKSATTLIQTRGMAGVVGVISLFWAALQIFVNAAAPMNAAFRTRETRGWVRLRVIALGLFLACGLLFIGTVLVTTLMQQFSRSTHHLPYFKQDPSGMLSAGITTFFVFLGLVVSIAINAVMFGLIYRFLPAPGATVRWRAAAIAGTIIAFLWEAAKQAFTFYLTRFANYNKLYGSLGGLIALIFWIYYSSMILLLGAEIAKLIQDAAEAREGGPKQRGGRKILPSRRRR